MREPLTPLKLPPGIYRSGTKYQSKGRYYESNLIRFFEGTIQPIGGWSRLQTGDVPPANLAALTGTPRAVRSWRAADGQIYTAVATISTTANQSKLYVITGMFGTPTHATSFDETVAGGLAVGKIDAGAGGTVGAYGAGFYGAGLYGSGQTGGTWTDADTWQLDTFGAYLIANCTIDQQIYVWAANTGTASAKPVWSPTFTGSLVTSGVTAGGATTIILTATTLTGTILAGQRFIISGTTYTATSNATAAANLLTVSVTPAVPIAGIAATTAVTGYDQQAPLAHAVVVTPERFLVALGANSNVRNVWWCDQESTTQWGELSTNAAGQYELKTDGRILFGAKTRNQTLIMTDVDLWAMTYIGGTFIYRFDQAGTNCGATSANAGAASDTRYFWMGANNFWVYDGFVKALPSPVADYVFGRINQAQKSKVWCMARPQYGEIWWHYPSGSSLECNSYVVYNEREDHWTIGESAWAAGFENGATQYPILCDTSGQVWEHENQQVRVGTAYLETGPIEVGQGDNVIKIQHVVGDVSTTAGVGDLTVKVYTAMLPTDTETLSSAYQLMPNPTSLRHTAKIVRFRFDEVTANSWRLGDIRVGAILGGSR